MPAGKKVVQAGKGSGAGRLGSLIEQVRSLVQSARRTAAVSVNTLQVLTNFEIGRRIVEHEQKGAKRAEYGAALIKALSARLTAEFGRGFSEDNLARMRNFYVAWKDRVFEFPRSLRGNLELEISPDTSGNLLISEKSRKPSAQSAKAFALRWSHCVLLLSIKDANERGRRVRTAHA